MVVTNTQYYYNKGATIERRERRRATGAAETGASAAPQQARVTPGDIVLEANGTRLATSKHHRPRMGFFAAISIIRYAALPVTLRFLRKSRAKQRPPLAALPTDPPAAGESLILDY